MPYQPGSTFYESFILSLPNGSAVDADSPPGVVLRRNGVNTGVTISTPTNGGGDYTSTAVIPADWVAGDVLELLVSAQVSSIVQKKILPLGKLVSVESLGTPSASSSLIASSVGGLEKPFTIFQSTTGTFKWVIVDGNGNQVNLTGHSIVFYLHDVNTDVIVATVNGGNVVLSRSDVAGHPTIYDTVLVTVLPTHIPNAGKFEYKVRDLTANLIYGSGSFIVKWAP